MSARRSVAAIIAVAIAFLLAPATGAARRSPSPLVDQINTVRKVHGLSPARYSRSLSRSSARFSRRLARAQRFAHGSRIVADRGFSRLGEVLALTRGWEVRRRRTLGHWLRSPSHRAVLLDRSFRYVGAARVAGYYGGSPVIFWTVQFGRV